MSEALAERPIAQKRDRNHLRVVESPVVEKESVEGIKETIFLSWRDVHNEAYKLTHDPYASMVDKDRAIGQAIALSSLAQKVGLGKRIREYKSPHTPSKITNRKPAPNGTY
jgi:hypothetical protein